MIFIILLHGKYIFKYFFLLVEDELQLLQQKQ